MTVIKLHDWQSPGNGVLPTLAYRSTCAALQRTLIKAVDGITVIVGMSGIGKTTAIKAFANGQQNVALCTLTRLSRGAQTGLIRINNALGEHTPEKGVNLEDTVKRRLGWLRLKYEHHQSLLIIDEAQHASVDLLEEIRHLWDATEVGIVLVGNDELRATIDELSRKHPQIRTRFGAYVDLDALDGRDIDLLCRDRNITPDGVARIRELARLGGALRTARNLLSMAGELCGGEGARIDLRHVNEAATMMGLIR